ncbi:alpha/beta fold hydrolase [Subtercola sp. YIM 133946]|uniref:alpha/beta fold hydrolase n=1 Tax=Subtercola sp. YIM 133946 TaxID=3118909 RepID=UPI002F9303DE
MVSAARAGRVGDEYGVFSMAGPPGIRRQTFLLLHGVGLSHRSFTRMAAVLAGAGGVIAIDLPGFGGTGRPQGPRSVAEYARGIAAVLDRSDAGPVVVVGHSMGCQFALELALSRPDLVSAVVMIGPVVDPRARTLLQQGLRLLRDAALEPLRTNAMVTFDYARCGLRWFVTESRAMLDYPTHERIAGLQQPLLVLRGARDPIAVNEFTQRLAGQVARGRAESTATGRHNVLHSHPFDVAARIIGFAGAVGSESHRQGPPSQ